MLSPLFRLYKSDVVQSIISSVLTAVLVTIYQAISVPNFDLVTAPWGSIMHASLSVAFITFFSVLTHKFATDSNGQTLGTI